MAPNSCSRNNSIGGALILIAVGVFFLILNLHPELDAWSIILRYWPVLLIAIGLGHMWDAWMDRRYSDPAAPRRNVGAPIAILIILLLLGLAAWHGRRSRPLLHDTRQVSLQGAKSVTADIEIPAGTLDVSGGASQLLDATFDYHDEDGKPDVEYSVANGRGDLSITQESNHHIHFSTAHNEWRLRFANDVPLDLNVRIGAGQSDLRLPGLNINNLSVNVGVGQMTLDLTGPRKSDLRVDVHGGVGSADVLLPRDVGVRVHASGGIGDVGAHGGLTRDGDDYVNSVVGKTPATIDVTIEGGVGTVSLQLAP
ncbi:MAG: toast rack family protein [Candidatus Acidiferrales bacterium]